MKFLMFADFHYWPGVFYPASLERLQALQARAVEEGCDMILHAGDLCHGPSKVPELMALCDSSPVPMYHCLGNHDTDGTSLAETLKAYHMPDGHYHFDMGGYRFVVLDPNYCKLDGQYIHYELGNYFQWPGNRDHTPPEQLQWLEDTLESSPYPCILVSHDSYEREVNSSRDFKQVQEILRRVNERHHGRVLMVMNGHHHRDHLRVLDNILHWDVNSASYDWVGEEKHDKFPKELTQQYRCAANTVIYNDTLHAIVTLEGSTITIEGMESTMFMGINREDIGAKRLDLSSRPVVPKIQSCKITLW